MFQHSIIIDFIKKVKEDEINPLIKAKIGLHILVGINKDNGKVEYVQHERYYKNKEESDFIKRCKLLLNKSWNLQMNKTLDTKKKIHTVSYFCVGFKKENFNQKLNFDGYFSNAEEFLSDKIIYECESFKTYFLNDDYKNTVLKLKNVQADYKETKDSDYIFFYLDVEDNYYFDSYKEYFAKYCFLINDYNIETDGGIKYGIPSLMTTYNVGKPFLKHYNYQTDVSHRIVGEDAYELYKFTNLLRTNKLPNPLPITTQGIEISLLSDSGTRKKPFRETIKKILDGSQEGCYLIKYSLSKDLVIEDFERIENTNYPLGKEKKWVIKDIFDNKNSENIEDVFDFEKYVVTVLFNNCLVNDEGKWNYLSQITTKETGTTSMFYLIREYQSKMFDFIYKAKINALSAEDFNKICFKSILDDILSDTVKYGRHSHKEQIKRKLNIWISLINNFSNNHNLNFNMQKSVKVIEDIVSDNYNYSMSDVEYCFIVGQLITYIQSKSKSNDNSYKYLDVFTKCDTNKKLTEELSKHFTKYTHENFNKKFNKVFPLIISDQRTINVKQFLRFIIAGAIAKNNFYSTQK